MRYELKSIPIWPFTKVAFFINLIVGFIFGFFYALFLGFFMSVISNFPVFQTEEFPMETLPVGMLVIILPFVCAIFGAFLNTLIGIVLVLIYNLIAKLVGGVELNLQPVQTTQLVTPSAQPITAQTASTSYAAPIPPPPVTPKPPPEPPVHGLSSPDQKDVPPSVDTRHPDDTNPENINGNTPL